ncbi:hypothetical protein XFF6166_690016 [Xanthomonas citri pv. fuscans]|nr:hypothetical protein XFF6166_690016 [Xanthomonas citri pv. fuscans]SOO02414.1 hypothetical protein XFF6960_600020 [Xanthomonas citri pv. fuscans]SOO05066.1 hypothetical protein XFF7767_350019 [Xanthomonas citri pv. fuscans]SOO10884.1 hypothetical protein XFF6970_660107 [Xanthomonas citri pv. fuscans]SOO15342.1 hypothetical protein XFF7766_540018 [Xanthomonas citri pv. fuscans]
MGMCGQAGLRRDDGYGCGQLVNVGIFASAAGFAGDQRRPHISASVRQTEDRGPAKPHLRRVPLGPNALLSTYRLHPRRAHCLESGFPQLA